MQNCISKSLKVSKRHLSVGEREVLRWRKMEMFIPINNENGRMPIMMQLMLMIRMIRII